MIRLINITLLILIILIIISCSIITPRDYNNDSNSLQWRKHQSDLHNLRQYQANGMLIFISNKRKIYVHFFWQQINLNYYRIVFTDSFGNKKLKFDIKPGLVQLNDKSQYYTNGNIEIIIDKLNNITIPFDMLNKWILGLPGHAAKYKINNKNLLSEIYYPYNKKFWKIVYYDYYTNIVPALPKSIELNEGEQYLKIKIHKWIIK